jgi:uncharacterized membrane protein
MSYLLLKWVHILSSTVLFGTGMGIAFFQFMTWRTGDVAAIARVTRLTVIADFVFTTPAVVVQLLTGFALLHLLSLPLTTGWVLGALALYALTGACWLPVVAIQVAWRGSPPLRTPATSRSRPGSIAPCACGSCSAGRPSWRCWRSSG